MTLHVPPAGPATNLNRIRWGIRAVLVLGLTASTVANILHARDNPISQAISAWPVVALYLTIEVISRVPIHRRSVAFARMVAAAVIAGIAAWVSYWHMAGVASKFGETGASPYLLPLSVDGLIVVASICLVELGGRIRDAGLSAPVSTDGFDHARPIGPMPAPKRPDKLSPPNPPARKPHPSTRELVERAHKRTPTATHDQLAERLKLSTKTVQRYRPERPPEAAQLNGREPDLANRN